MDNTNTVLTFQLSFVVDAIHLEEFKEKEKEYGFHRIKERLEKSLYKYKHRHINDNFIRNNIIYSAIYDRFQRQFSFLGNTRAYLANYSEESGSFVISFTVLVIGAVATYGSIRTGLDYFAEDIKKLLYVSLKHLDNNEEYTVIADVKDFNDEQTLLSQHTRTSDTNPDNILFSKIRQTAIIIGMISIILLIVAITLFFSSNKNIEKQDRINELIIRKIVEDEVRNQRIDNFLNNVSTNTIEKGN